MAITNIEELNSAIKSLEIKQKEEYDLLKVQFATTLEELKPINLLKNSINKLTGDGDLKDKVINSTMGLIAGALGKKMLVGSTHNPVKSLFGTLLQLGITGLVTKNASGIRSGIGEIVMRFLKNKV